jgi:DNA repair protein RecN (Recombination protein N)
MLQEIYINNFVLIDELRLEFGNGLNVLSGETGAGKSIIIDALGLVTGDRVRSDFIKDSTRRAVVEAVFNIDNHPGVQYFLQEHEFLDDDEQLIIRREISPEGRSTARVNGRSVNTSTLKSLAGQLIDMHLQHEHLSILRPEFYLGYVDSLSPGSHDLLPRVKSRFEEIKRKSQELEQLNLDEMNKKQRIDFLQYQINEIEQAHLNPEEEEELHNLSKRIKNARKLLEGSQRLINLLYDGRENQNVNDLISLAISTCADLDEEPFFKDLMDELQEMYFNLKERVAAVSAYRDTLDFEPGLQEQVEERLYTIKKLKNKYGSTIKEVLEYLERAKEEKMALDRSEETRVELSREIENLQREYFDWAGQLSQIRNGGAEKLQMLVKKELYDLNMPHIQFEITVNNCQPGASGIDKVEFNFSANPGEELRPISKIASGGEISRFVLALKKALTSVYAIPTLIFDEIDIGVGGTSLTAMALKLRELADNHQVILVTHSPQVASYAQHHFLIEKQIIDNKTSTRIKVLNDEEKVREIARMLGGDNFSEITLVHAQEMYRQAQINFA